MDHTSPRMSAAGRVYLTAVIAAGLVVIAASLYGVQVQPLDYQWYVLAALALVSGSATVKLPSVPASISVSETFVFTAVLLFGPAAGTITVVLEGLIISFWMSRRRPEWYRAFFNMSAPAISCWCAAQLLFAISGLEPLSQRPSSLNNLLIPVAVFALVYFTLNSWLIAFAVRFETKLSALTIWRTNFLWLSLNYFSAASVALLLVIYTRNVDIRFIGVAVPLILGFYLIFRISMARVEDANTHLKQLNHLYLSTIETLAMAIDAKDQITHGHIRRVQVLAVGLAKEVGVKDPALIRAIEAAALLHDMGKLAVPEYILNKPGRLTRAEFEKMKLHASVGADILSAIEFPYPVVPIVRHHHENWDGSGYPAGLSGTDIPIGARILSVVDCFDALTSDRPYRPKLSNDDALAILLQRKGSMYDPLVIDTFVKVHEKIASQSAVIGLPKNALNEITNAIHTGAPTSVSAPHLDEISASADEMLTLYELAHALSGQASLTDTGDVLAKHLKRLIPSSLCVFYLYDCDRDELEAKYAFGEHAGVFKGVRIGFGERLSGWVAANRQTISNSDPALDFGETARAVTPHLRSSLSTPLLVDDQIVGTISLYSSLENGFSDDHKRVLEVVAPQIAHTLKQATAFENTPRRDLLTGLPQVSQLESALMFTATTQSDDAYSHSSLLLINVSELKDINAKFGRSVGDEALRHVALQIRSCLRVADILFRGTGNEFVALLSETDVEAAKALAARIDEALAANPLAGRSPEPICVRVLTSCLKVPTDVGSVSELVALLRSNVSSSLRISEQTIH